MLPYVDRGRGVESGRAVPEAQTRSGQLRLDLVDGLRTEVADVHQVRLGTCQKLTREIRKAVGQAELPACWLLAEWPAAEPEQVQFWLSNLPADTPLTTLVRLAKLRWRMEHGFRERKQALGLAHFEGRTWNGWHHHVPLVSAAHAFCTLQRLARTPKETAPA
ncbi:SRSO17 transposase [Streptomyces sp. SLBN-8D4]